METEDEQVVRRDRVQSSFACLLNPAISLAVRYPILLALQPRQGYVARKGKCGLTECIQASLEIEPSDFRPTGRPGFAGGLRSNNVILHSINQVLRALTLLPQPLSIVDRVLET
jgi:hypothetical protein